jgi:lactoylglutathione lyase
MTPVTQSTESRGVSEQSSLTAFRPSVMYVCYYVADVDRALSFYTGLLGMQERLRIPLGNGVNEVVLAFPESKGPGVILMWDEKRAAPYDRGDAYSRLVVRVSDVNGATQALRSAGVSVVTEPTDAPGLRYSMVRDPDGYIVELLELKRA